MQKTALLSDCGLYRYTLGRRWDERPLLLVMMFNPSEADAEVDDPTISLLCHIASHNGFGGITVVNLVPQRGSDPENAIAMVRAAGLMPEDPAHPLRINLDHVQEQAAKAGAFLVGWGNLAPPDLAGYVQQMTREVVAALPPAVCVFCLGTTKNGNPLHPMARGKMKVPKTAPLKPWMLPQSATNAAVDLSVDTDNPATCSKCGCTDRHACRGGCYWVSLDRANRTGVCSSCVPN